VSVVRTVVLPVLRLLVWAVIAAALVVLAFRGGGGDAAQPGPSAPPVDLASPVVPVARGTVANTVTVQGTVVADPVVAVRATKAGTVRRLLVEPGDVVAQGAPLLEIRWEEEREPVTSTDPGGNPTVTPQPPWVRTAVVPAPAAGTVSAVDVLAEQVVAVGDRVGGISPGTLSVTASLTQDDRFRLLSPPSTAQVQVEGGPAPFPCGGLTLGAPATDTGGAGDPGSPPVDPAAPPGGQGGGTTARCSVPQGTTVFAGMAATVVVEAGLARDVLVVPVTAVQGSVQQGNVWVVGPDGEPAQRPVTLGLTDGEQVEVRDGLAEGDEVLLFVPVPDDSVEEPVYGGPVG
jgi:multidrug efflux pump subunit AcrA (membrane-fusion protein)